ncbi:phosphotyrosine protein phosphatase [Sphingomonas parva]|uniref:Phosphotyrosine protein phosphatase n=1 Tax=Sphingomonas parva TaxID=2555898 RepID=A0A4Y8ZK33_9SPHN|nr:phosphotyrosine protein phosphatase [Sphingomonas parva]TFI56361.1 phosphotyrosine protein phosphatase [Sphingomonas parva]
MPEDQPTEPPEVQSESPRRLLFVCSRNRLRSPTAEAICQNIDGIEAISAGTNNDAEQPLTGDLIDWADVVIAMERTHRHRINSKFRAQMKGKELVVLGIPDDYEYMQPELVSLLKVRLQRWMGAR